MGPLFLVIALAQADVGSLGQAPAPELPPATWARGAHFDVAAYGAPQAVADEALAVAESVAAPLESVFGKLAMPEGPDPGSPERVHIRLYARASDLVTVRRLFDGDNWRSAMPPLGEFTDPVTHVAHVPLYPGPSIEALATLGLPSTSRYVIAREAGHALTSLHPSIAKLPWSFSLGAVCWAAEEGLAAKGWVRNRMEDPAFSTEALRVRVLAEHRALPSLEAIVAGWPGGLVRAERRGVAAHAFRFLKDPAREAVFAQLRGAALAFDGTAQGEARMTAALGDAATRAALEEQFTAHALGLGPRWDETWPALSTSGTNWLQCAADSNALAWRTNPAVVEQYEIDGELEILPGATQQMNVLLAGGPKGFVQVSFVAGYGIDVFRFDREKPAKEQWTKLATVEVKGLTTGRSIPFRVSVDGTNVSVSVSGKRACHAPLAPSAVAGRWGLGVQAGSAGHWRKIAFGHL